jgi:nicotinate-nucleotide adenylyltransferase
MTGTRPDAARLGVMGGTFDPIHNGHLVAATQVAESMALDRVLFVPTGHSWQKDDSQVSSPQDRFLMTLLATVDDPLFAVSRVDLDRHGPTYTVDTLSDLSANHPNSDLFFITGADALASLHTWRDYERIIDRATLVGVSRPGHALADPGLPAGTVHLVEISALAISSTECRQRAAAGLSLDYLVPSPVARYVEKKGLYR